MLSYRASKIFKEIMNLLHTVGDVLSNLPDNYSSVYVLSELLEIILPSDDNWKKLRENLAFVSIVEISIKNVLYFLGCYSSDETLFVLCLFIHHRICAQKLYKSETKSIF